MTTPEQGKPSNLPTDTVTTGEYEEAFNGLKRFVELDPAEIRNIQDLSAKASLIGHHVHKVISSKGTVMYETSFSANGAEERRRYVFDKELNDSHLLAYSESGFVSLRKYDDKKYANFFWHPGFSIKVPSAGDIILCDPKKVEAVRIREKKYSAEDQERFKNNPRFLFEGFPYLQQEGYASGFYPLLYPTDLEHNQTFSRLIHEFLEDLLEVLPQPQSVPPAFKF